MILKGRYGNFHNSCFVAFALPSSDIKLAINYALLMYLQNEFPRWQDISNKKNYKKIAIKNITLPSGA
jgi:hypothetical protein